MSLLIRPPSFKVRSTSSFKLRYFYKFPFCLRITPISFSFDYSLSLIIYYLEIFDLNCLHRLQQMISGFRNDKKKKYQYNDLIQRVIENVISPRYTDSLSFVFTTHKIDQVLRERKNNRTVLNVDSEFLTISVFYLFST